MAAIVQISRIQHRTGLYRELPTALNEAELGWALDTRQLFIGNGPIHPGNTEIITQHSPASSFNYSYRSPSAYQQLLASGALVELNPFTASTGFLSLTGGPGNNEFVPSSLTPTVRSYQEKFDEIVSIKDYGAVGDLNTDDTGSIIRAIIDLFSEKNGEVDPSNPDAVKRQVALHVPEGIYRIRAQLPLVPGLTIIGTPGKSIFYLDTELATADDNNDGVFISADSFAQVYPDMGNDTGDGYPEIPNPSNIYIEGLIMRSNHDRNVTVSKRQIVRITQGYKIKFIKCGFEFVAKAEGVFPETHPWEDGDSPENAQSAILITKLNNDTIPQTTDVDFIGCSFFGGAHDINIIDGTANVNMDYCDFNGKLTPIKIGYDSTIDLDATYRDPTGTAIIERISISNSTFNGGYTDYAVKVLGNAQFVHSFSNFYGNDTGASIYFASTTVHCSSAHDAFENIEAASCGTANTRIVNLSSSTTIFNSQDFKVFPIGVQDLTVCGTLTVDGVILINPPTVTSLTITTVAYPSTTLAQPNAYKGNSVKMDYAMRIPNGGSNILRTGTLKIIYTESSPGIGGDIQYSDDYVEVGGIGGSGLTLSATFDNIAQQIKIVATSSIGTPTTRYIINAYSI